jgi:hypothetical protein
LYLSLAPYISRTDVNANVFSHLKEERKKNFKGKTEQQQKRRRGRIRRNQVRIGENEEIKRCNYYLFYSFFLSRFLLIDLPVICSNK